jgi:hypothetical protein
LPKEVSEKRRIEIKSRAAAKQQTQTVVTSADNDVNIGKQKCQLLSNQERFVICILLYR